jgi:hypothetical protein
MYKISDRTYKIAKKLGIQIFQSDNPKKKIEIYDFNGNFITYIGDSKYNDYHSYLEMEKNGEVLPGFAEKRRHLYHTRHFKEIEKLGEEWEGSPSYYSFFLLWS